MDEGIGMASCGNNTSSCRSIGSDSSSATSTINGSHNGSNYCSSGIVNNGNPISLAINDTHIQCLIFQYFTAKELCHIITLVSQRWKQSEAMDNMWRLLCHQRWNLTDRSRKSLGGMTSSMRDVYKLFYQRLQIPDGKFTSKQNIVFGKCMEYGLGGWLLVNHGTTAMLKESRYQGQLLHRIELRLCIQNLSHAWVRVPLQSSLVDLYCNPSEEVNNGELIHSELRVIAMNGIPLVSSSSNAAFDPMNGNSLLSSTTHAVVLTPDRSDVKRGSSIVSSIATATNSSIEQGSVTLKRMEFAVMSFFVYVPDSIESEPDCLTMITKLLVKIPKVNVSTWHNEYANPSLLRMKSIMSPGSAKTSSFVELHVKRSRDEIIWSNYQTLPNGLVMVRDHQTNW